MSFEKLALVALVVLIVAAVVVVMRGPGEAPPIEPKGPALGDAAAPLQIAEWLKGDPVDLEAGRGDHFYVIEFWATWCQPCRLTIPRLTRMQKEHRDAGLVVIGVTEEAPGVARPFVEKMGDEMDYTIACDALSATTVDYRGAYGADSLPWAFLVDTRGRIVWHGPALDPALEEQVAQMAERVGGDG
ncbi:MAG: TlpA family protein disulfide reductase [bacterium]|nr:TlpA family protein disulfide reductase [bacterium]